MPSAWLTFLKGYYAKNKGKMSYKQAMVAGAKVYKSQKGKKKAPKRVARRRRRKADES